MVRGANKERFLDEDHCYPEKLNKNCDRCRSKAQACDVAPYSGLTCERCSDSGDPCVWSAPDNTTRGINDVAKMKQQGLVLGKSQKAVESQDVVKKTHKSKSAGADEFVPGLRELGSGRHKKDEVKAGPSRLDREREDRPRPKPTEFDFFKGDKYGGSKKQSRQEDDRSRRPERDNKNLGESRRKRDLTPESSALSSASSPESQTRKPKRKERDERDDYSSSKRRSPPPPAASALKVKDQDRTVSGTSATSIPGPHKKKRQIVESSDEEDQAGPKSPEITTKRLEDDTSRKDKKPRLDDRDETPRKRPRDDDERPKQRDRSRDEFSRRKEPRTDDDGRPRPKERVERDRSREDRRGEIDDRKKIRRDEGFRGDRADRDERDRPKKIKREDREEGAKAKRDRDDGEPSGKRPREERDTKDSREEGDKFFDSLNKSKRDDTDRDESRAEPIRKKRRLSDDNDRDAIAKPEDEPSQYKNKQHSVLAQRALDPKRTKPDTPSQTGDASPVTRKPARPMGNASGRSTPMGKSKPPMGDAISDLLTASLVGASAGYASSLGVKTAPVRDRYSGRMDRSFIKPAAPVVPVTRGTLNLMGTLKSISDFQTAAKRRYEHSYGLKPEGTAKTTQTTAFMKRFREQRARGAYNNALSTLCTPPQVTTPVKDPAEASEVQRWLAEHGTAPLAAPRMSAPVIRVTLAEPIIPAPSIAEPIRAEESGTTSDNPIAV